MRALSQRRWAPIATAAVVAVSVGALGGLATELGPWYYSLRMPPWKPPDWLFGPVWTLIYGLSAMAAVSAWWNSRTSANRFRVLILFAVNSLLGIAWSVIFFSMRRPDWALVEVVFLWMSIAALIAGLYPISRAASCFLVPYLIWVSFASVLNLEVTKLNSFPQ